MLPWSRTITAVALLLAAAADHSADGSAVLATMKQAAGKLEKLRALVRIEEQLGSAVPAVRFVECWVDVRGGRVRTEQRNFGNGAAHLVNVVDRERLRIRQLQVGEVAEQVRTFDLPTALTAALSGDLIGSAFQGRPPTLSASAYGKPELAAQGEVVRGVGCTRVHFPGNTVADLWIGDVDHFPRHLHGKVGEVTIDETLLEIDLAPDLGGVGFSIDVPDGSHLLSLAEARKSWSTPPADEARWPQPLDDAPDFAGVDLTGTIHLLSETAEQEAILALWTTENDGSVELAAQAEAAFRVRPRERFLFRHVAAGNDRDGVAAAMKKRSLREPVLVAGTHPRNAFLQLGVWKCPVFVRVSDMQVVAVTSDLTQVREWLK